MSQFCLVFLYRVPFSHGYRAYKMGGGRGLSGGLACIKYLMFSFNLIFWVSNLLISDVMSKISSLQIDQFETENIGYNNLVAVESEVPMLSRRKILQCVKLPALYFSQKVGLLLYKLYFILTVDRPSINRIWNLGSGRWYIQGFSIRYKLCRSSVCWYRVYGCWIYHHDMWLLWMLRCY